MIYELISNGKVLANSGDYEWISTEALSWHSKRSFHPIELVSRKA